MLKSTFFHRGYLDSILRLHRCALHLKVCKNINEVYWKKTALSSISHKKPTPECPVEQNFHPRLKKVTVKCQLCMLMLIKIDYLTQYLHVAYINGHY